VDAKHAAKIGVFAAMVAVATMAITIPIPGVHGFVNFGDTIIILSSLLFGPVVGGLAGAIGSGMADMLLGYAHWAPWTIVIKGMEGVIVGRLRHNPVPAAIAGAVFMIAGYFVAAGVMYGFAPAIAAIPMDGIQGGLSVIAGLLLFKALRTYIDAQ